MVDSIRFRGLRSWKLVQCTLYMDACMEEWIMMINIRLIGLRICFWMDACMERCLHKLMHIYKKIDSRVYVTWYQGRGAVR